MNEKSVGLISKTFSKRPSFTIQLVMKLEKEDF